MKKNDSMHIPISTEQKNKLIAEADKLGLSLSSYVLLILNSARVKIQEVTIK